jgi:glycosyltransferase involved in cell wall biosynthesis
MNSRPPYKIAWLTTVPSGDQIDLLRAAALRPEISLTVIYCSPDSVKGEIDSREPFGRGQVLQGLRLPGPGGKLYLNPSIISHLWRARYDLLIVAGYIHPTMQLAMMVCILLKQPWILFAERPGVSRRSLWSRVLRSVPLFTLRSADALIGTGGLAQAQYQNLCGAGVSVFSLPYLVDLKPFLGIERTDGRAPNGLNFLACGELIPRKGTDVLVRAFAKAAQSCPDIALRIVGDGSERFKLAEQIPDSVRNRIVFAGSVPFAERSGPFARSDVFIHPARHDGWGVVIQEALSAGLPVIATRQTGAAYDLIEEGKNGFLVDAGNEDELCQRIVWFAHHRDEIRELGANARNKARTLTPEWGAEEIVRIARTVLRNRGWETT